MCIGTPHYLSRLPRLKLASTESDVPLLRECMRHGGPVFHASESCELEDGSSTNQYQIIGRSLEFIVFVVVLDPLITKEPLNFATAQV